MEMLNKKYVVAFAKNVVKNLDSPSYYLISDCGKMKVEIVKECPVLLRKNAENNIVQINPIIAKKYKKSTILFFIVWEFLKEYEKTDLETDDETMSLLIRELPNWCAPLDAFVSDFCNVLSVNINESNQKRCQFMIDLQFLNY